MEDTSRTHRARLEHIYRRYSVDLFAYGMSLRADALLVEDALHDVFMDIYLHPETFAAVQNHKYYLMKCLRHRIILLRGKEFLYDLYSNIDDDMSVPDEHVLFPLGADEELIVVEEETARQRQYRYFMQHLNPHQCEALHLRLVEGLPFGEIAQIMNINRQSAQNLFQRAIDKLRVVAKTATAKIV